MDNDVGELCYVACLFALGVPSEALRLTRAYADDTVTQVTPKREHPLATVWKYDQTFALVIKCSYRKNIRKGGHTDEAVPLQGTIRGRKQTIPGECNMDVHSGDG